MDVIGLNGVVGNSEAKVRGIRRGLVEDRSEMFRSDEHFVFEVDVEGSVPVDAFSFSMGHSLTMNPLSS